jgi:hypothetical protein
MIIEINEKTLVVKANTESKHWQIAKNAYAGLLLQEVHRLINEKIYRQQKIDMDIKEKIRKNNNKAFFEVA